MSKAIYFFPDQDATQAQVGGKGFSLIKLAGGGFPVPASMVLGVDFFAPWIQQLQAETTLRLQLQDDENSLKHKTSALQRAADKLVFNAWQKHALAAALDELETTPDQLFAVRSSSPEEDMEGASFAGMYATYLGVTAERLAECIRKVFVSCLDYRVVAYKRQKGFDFTQYGIAVVVMAQIDSDVAGVAFSINPLNNCYDEVVINANFGLGETVVAGNASPDTYIVDRVNQTILAKQIGSKQTALVLAERGGTRETSGPAAQTAALSDACILTLADMVARIERYYDMPMDIEWAWADDRFYMLQARPITTYIPLHPAFLTVPGEPKKLYLDLTLIEQGIQKPLSVMGTECFRILSNAMGLSAAGVAVAEKPGDIIYAAGGRAYVNLTDEIMLEGQKGAAREYEGLDSAAAQIIREMDMAPYKGKATAAGAWKTVKGICTAMFKSADTIAGIIQGNRHPDRLRAVIDAKGAAFMQAIDDLDASDISFGAFAEQSMRMAADLMIHTTIPSLIDAEAAKNGLQKLFAGQF